MLTLRFATTIIHWRGPSPFFYAPIPSEHGEAIRRIAKIASYGWGVIPVRATIKGAEFTTSLFPKDGTYLLPLKAAVRKQINVTVDDRIDVEMVIERAR